jgi:hypothetical protein
MQRRRPSRSRCAATFTTSSARHVAADCRGGENTLPPRRARSGRRVDRHLAAAGEGGAAQGAAGLPRMSSPSACSRSAIRPCVRSPPIVSGPSSSTGALVTALLEARGLKAHRAETAARGSPSSTRRPRASPQGDLVVVRAPRQRQERRSARARTVLPGVSGELLLSAGPRG